MFLKHVLHASKQMYLIQIKNIFACQQANVGSFVHACQLCHADLVACETGKQSDQDRIVMLDKQCWPVPVSSGL